MNKAVGYPSCYFDDDNWDDDPPVRSYLDHLEERASSSMTSRQARESPDFLEVRRNDDEARRRRVERGVWNVKTRSCFSLEDVKFCLYNYNFYYDNKNVRHFPPLRDRRYKLDDHPLIREVSSNVNRFRIMAVDTENKEGKIFLIIGDLFGNVIFFNDALNLPVEFEDDLKDVKVYKIQSNIQEDYKVLKDIGIKMVGLADTQAIFAAFVKPGSKGVIGTEAQANFTGHHVIRFHHRKMNFRCNHPNADSIKHATSDARQPIVTLMKAAEIRALSYPVPLKPENDCYKLLWDICNRVAGVSVKVAEFGLHNSINRSIDDNWTIGRKDDYATGTINNRERVVAIEASQKDWPVVFEKKKEKAVHVATRTTEKRQANNRRRSLLSRQKRDERLREDRREERRRKREERRLAKADERR